MFCSLYCNQVNQVSEGLTQALEIDVGYPESCRRRTEIPRCSPRFAALFSTRAGPFRLLLPLPCPPASTSPGEGLPGGLKESSCGRRKRGSMPNRLNVGMYARLVLMFSSAIPWRRKLRFGRVAKRAPAGSPFATRATQRASERTPVELD